MLARVLMTLEACFVLISNSPAMALTSAPLVIAFLPELAFMACLVFGGNIWVAFGEHQGCREKPGRLARDQSPLYD